MKSIWNGLDAVILLLNNSPLMIGLFLFLQPLTPKLVRINRRCINPYFIPLSIFKHLTVSVMNALIILINSHKCKITTCHIMNGRVTGDIVNISKMKPYCSEHTIEFMTF